MHNTFDFTELKSKYKKSHRIGVYMTLLTQTLVSMFKYDNIPDGLNTEMLEKYLIQHGCVGITEYNDKIVAMRANLLPPYDIYDNYTRAHLQSTIYNTDIDDMVDGVIAYNNCTHTPDYNIGRFASILADVDKAQHKLITKTMVNPIVTVHNAKQKNLISNALKIQDSDDTPVVDLAIPAFSDDTETIGTLDLVNYELVKCIDSLNTFTSALHKRLYSMYGITITNSIKSAQTNDTELTGELIKSTILTNDRLKQRREMCNNINKLYNTNITVDFNDSWQYNIKMLNNFIESLNDSRGDDINADKTDDTDDNTK